MQHSRSAIAGSQADTAPATLPAAPGRVTHAARWVAASGIVAVWAVINVVADAALIFSGPLAPGLLHGASALLAAFALASITIGLASGLAGMASTTICAVIYAAMAGAVDHALAATVPDAVLRANVVVVFGGAATMMCGLALLLFGALRLGSLAQFLPYPVIAGYYAGLAALLSAGGLSVGTDLAIGRASLAWLADPSVLARAGACLGLAALLVWLPRWRRHWSTVPVVLAAVAVLFHATRLLLQVDVPTAEAEGWLLGPFPAGAAHLSAVPLFDALHANVVALAAPYAASAVVIASVTLLMMVGGVELEMRTSIEPNRELAVAGIANLLGGAIGGTPCTQSVTTTAMLHRLGGGTRVGTIIPGLAALALVLVGAKALELVPRFLVGALLLSFGLERLLLTWQDCRTLPRYETAVVLLVLAATAALGIVTGLEIGLGVALLIFAINYRRIPVIRPALSGALCRSSVSRSPQAEAVLRRDGDATLIFRLQGYLFFLNVGGISAAIASEHGPRCTSIILDFQDVVGMDSSAHGAFWRSEQMASKMGAEILLCGLAPPVEAQFRQRGLLRDDTARVRRFETLDLALQHAEDRLLRAAGLGAGETRQSLADHISTTLGEPVDEQRLAAFLQPVRLAAGEVLIRQGEHDRSMYFIELGRVSIWLEREGTGPVRLSSTAAGGLVGELALYRGGVRVATVIADESTEVTRLTAEELARMEREEPQLAALLQRCLVLQLADKLANTTRLLRTLLR